MNKYFNNNNSTEAFSNLSEYEKVRYVNLKRNYEILLSTGITPKMPEFLALQKKVEGKSNVPKSYQAKDMNICTKNAMSTEEEFANLSEYEKVRYRSLKRNYDILLSTGITPKMPEFMLLQKKVTGKLNYVPKSNQTKQSCLKNVKFKLFGESGGKCQVNKRKVTFADDTSGKRTSSGSNAALLNNKVTCRNKDGCSTRYATAEFKELIHSLLNRSKNHLEFLKKAILSTKGVIADEEDNFFEEISQRYPRRSIPKKCYEEEELSSGDEYLFCDDCGCDYKGACPEHGPMILVCNKKVPKNVPNRAELTLPGFLSLGDSCAARNAGLGVWTERPLVRGTVFGPYDGIINKNQKKASKSGYAWQIRKGGRTLHYVEGCEESTSNWLRYVNCAATEDRQNVVAFQFKRSIFYRVYKDVLPHTELLVWYGGEFAKDLGIDLTHRKETENLNSVDGFHCESCGALFTSSASLEGHLKRHAHMQPDLKHRCPHCDYSSNHAHNLRDHILTHTGEKPHVCSHCGRGFAHVNSLIYHERTHTGEKPYSCAHCGRAFTQLANLRRHGRTHSGERPFRCASCGKDFNVQSHLRNHERIHTHQKPHRCPHCTRRFTQSGDLKSHVVSVHTRDFPHVCPLCGKGCRRPVDLKKHTARQHPNVEPSPDV